MVTKRGNMRETRDCECFARNNTMIYSVLNVLIRKLSVIRRFAGKSHLLSVTNEIKVRARTANILGILRVRSFLLGDGNSLVATLSYDLTSATHVLRTI